MSCDDAKIARDFIKNFENYTIENTIRNDRKSSSLSESDDKHDVQNSSSDTLQNDIFQKTYLSKVKRLIKKSANGESRKHRKRSSSYVCHVIPSKFYSASSRPTSLLEQQLLPDIKSWDDKIPGSSNDKSQGAQLTIFYQGTVNVYDNVSINKAKAIMILAGESCFRDPVTVADVSNTNFKESNSPAPISKFQANLPIATRHSLRLFFDKRQDRIKKMKVMDVDIDSSFHK